MSDSAMVFEGEEGATGSHMVAVNRVEVASLRPGLKLRLGEVNRDHVNVIASSEGDWPPIVVRRADNRIVDGHYRYLAARQLGLTHVNCVYFDGGDQAAFLEALERNRTHGLPLSLRERERAALQLLGFRRDWSDRRIAELCSLAPGTVGRLRTHLPRSNEQGDELQSRLGKDGKLRPVDPGASRARIVNLLRTKPDQSLREIARLAGTSPATVISVRSRLNSVSNEGGREEAPLATPACVPWRSDSALGSTDEGRDFAGWFERTDVDGQWRNYVDGIPVSRIYEVSDEARRRAGEWLAFASTLEERAKRRRSNRSV
jgi:hypothetical protein